jgi:hypothetical protein
MRAPDTAWGGVSSASEGDDGEAGHVGLHEATGSLKRDGKCEGRILGGVRDRALPPCLLGAFRRFVKNAALHQTLSAH